MRDVIMKVGQKMWYKLSRCS